MKKALLIFLLIILINGVIYILISPKTSPFRKKEIYIAAAGPITDTKGKAMLKGINSYLDVVNKKGGIDGKKVKLKVYDDKNDPETAEAIASKIADDNNALIVLGHYNSSTSNLAGKVYKRNEIPVITASASAESVTEGNEWYFRVIPNNTMQGGFAATYINKSMKNMEASLIFTKDADGISLAESFEKTAERIGMSVKNKWEWDKRKNAEKQAKDIADELKAAENPGVIFFATHSEEGLKIIVELGEQVKKYSILGSDMFARSLISETNKYPLEQQSPGHFTDGIYLLSPFGLDVVPPEIYATSLNFFREYAQNPNWIIATYYDAATVAVNAITKAGNHPKQHIREIRRNIREILQNYYDEQHAVRGITVYNYFDEKGDVKRPYSVGIFNKHKEIPSFFQYRQLTNVELGQNLLKQLLSGELVAIDDVFMNNIRIIYTGIEFIELSNLQASRSTCTLDFYIWFRYSGEFDETNIEFTNAINPVKLENPVKDETKDDITERKYRVKADFKIQVDYRYYPFSEHRIPIYFRHNSLTTDRLVYIPDELYLTYAFNPNIPNWTVTDISFHRDALIKQSSLGNPAYFDSPELISFSGFKAEIRLERNLLFIVKYFSLLITMLLMLYGVVCFAKPENINLRILTLMVILAITTGLYVALSQKAYLRFLTTTDVSYYTVYLFIILSAFVSIYLYRLHQRGDERKIKLVIRAWKIGYPVIFLFIILIYLINFNW